MCRAIGGLIALLCLFCPLAQGEAQSAPPRIALTGQPEAAALPRTTLASSRWEVTLDGQIGVPRGYIKVTETNAPGTRLRLHDDLGIDVSEAAELSVAYHFTPRDALRGTYLYAFLDGNTTLDHPVVFNGQTFGPGRLHTDADFYRLTLQYERMVIALGGGGSLTASAGLTYVNFNPTLKDGKSNSEDFYRQELPVPLLGVRVDYPLRGHLGLTASVAGGGLPRVDSLRKEGGTVWLQQSHADAGLGLTYALTTALRLDTGYHFTYFFQEEKSHEDQNTFQLFDNAFRVGLTLRF